MNSRRELNIPGIDLRKYNNNKRGAVVADYIIKKLRAANPQSKQAPFIVVKAYDSPLHKYFYVIKQGNMPVVRMFFGRRIASIQEYAGSIKIDNPEHATLIEETARSIGIENISYTFKVIPEKRKQKETSTLKQETPVLEKRLAEIQEEKAPPEAV